MSSKRWLPLLLLLNPMTLHAEAEDMPDDELLEFIGSFESSDGKWIDPSDFEIPLTDNKVAERGGNKDE